ncbi:MAG TPA: hypothetical protein V6C82_01420 [Chroococcales cyanobacterium]|jgi:hypothetical protein
MLVVLFFSFLIAGCWWWLHKKARQTELQHEIRLQRFLDGLREDGKDAEQPMELVKRIRKNPQSNE